MVFLPSAFGCDVTVTTIKKLLKTTSIAAVFILGISSARADTFYNFSQTFNLNGTNEVFAGTFSTTTGSGAQNITGWSNMTFGPVGTSYGVKYLYNGGLVGTYSYNPTTGRLYAMPTFTSDYVTNPYYVGSKMFAMYQNYSGQQLSRIFSYSADGSARRSSSSVSTFTITLAAAVPEIDGALIPQVGLLLAGLFIILGRKKESAEPLPAV